VSKLAVDLVCDIYSPSGYSNHAREIIRAIHGLVDLRIVDHKHDRISVQLDSMEAPLFRSLEEKTRKADVRIQFETPEFFQPVPDVVNIGFTEWETTRIPDTDYKGSERNNWVKQMNLMDGMLTSCASAAKAFVDTGVKVPICHFLGPVNTDMHSPAMPELAIEGLTVDSGGVFIPRDKRPLVVGMVAQWTLRKNIEDFLITLASRFKRDEIWILLKTYGSVMDQAHSKVIEKQASDILSWVKNPDAPQVTLVTEKLSDAEMAQLYSVMDVYVSTSRGEGFCLPVAQAMSTGVIPVVCGFFAPGEYVDHGINGYVLPYQLRPAVGMVHNPWYRADQSWADVDCMTLEQTLKKLIKLRNEPPAIDRAWDVMKAAARAAAQNKFSYDVTGQRMMMAIKEIMQCVRPGITV